MNSKAEMRTTVVPMKQVCQHSTFGASTPPNRIWARSLQILQHAMQWVFSCDDGNVSFAVMRCHVSSGTPAEVELLTHSSQLWLPTLQE